MTHRLPRPHTPVVVAELDRDRQSVLVRCPFCGQDERYLLALGPVQARCGGGAFRLVVRPVGGDAA